MEWLIKHKHLKLENGKHPNLNVANRQRPKKKSRYVPDYLCHIVRNQNIV